MMTRNHVTELLSAYIDDQVSPAERSHIETHLNQCAHCRGHLESLRGSVALVRGLDPVAAPEGFQETVRTKIAEAAVSPRQATILPHLRLSWKTAGVAAAALLVGIFSVNLVREMQPRRMVLEGQRDERQVDRSSAER
ncbi:MAG TPA: zf-HC2 domain-containing protein, partial [bacterium]|nr:zf-HC2 domain-containing protein [bacterium]